jgi:hypothetical protein
MVQLRDIAKALDEDRDGYEYLDVFADDIYELREGKLSGGGRTVRRESHPALTIPVEDKILLIELYVEQGIARCRLVSAQDQATESSSVEGMIPGDVLQRLLQVAREKKEGLLGGLVLGMLIGRGSRSPVEIVLAMQFDPVSKRWQLYDGPLLRWAKQTIQPAAGVGSAAST